MSCELLTLSDLYCQDVEPGSILVPEYPVSSVETYSNGIPVSTFFKNSHKYPLFDGFEVPEYDVYKYLSPQRFMAVAGGQLKIHTEIRPEPALEVHWARTLGNKMQLVYGSPLSHSKCVVLFPMESLSKQQHSVNPDQHYKLFSKLFIPDIPCPQARVLNVNSPKFPCVVKCAYGAASEGTFFANNITEYESILQLFKKTEPNAVVCVCEMVEDLRANYCCQFYLTKSGEVQWLGVGAQMMGEDGLWMGAQFSHNRQGKLESLLKPTLVPVARKLHENGYFGVVGVDVLVDNRDKQYVIDINPRLNGSTSMLLVSKFMGSLGWDHGIFLSGCQYNGNMTHLIGAAENVRGGVMMVFGTYEKEDGNIKCNVGVWSKNAKTCEDIFKTIFI